MRSVRIRNGQWENVDPGGLLDGMWSGESGLARRLGMWRRDGTLTFTPDGEEADAARGEERVVRVRRVPEGVQFQWMSEGKLVGSWFITTSRAATLGLSIFLGSEEDEAVWAIRRLPDAPKPVAVIGWRCRPGWLLCHRCKELQPVARDCRACQAHMELCDLPDPAGEGGE